MRKYTAVIVDDEDLCTKSLEIGLDQNCPEIEIVGVFNSPEKAVQEVRRLNPEIVYLDIEMPWMNGFEFLEALQPLTFEVIFTTAYDEFAIEAFRASATDYLLKPIEPSLLVKATQRAIDKILLNRQSDNIEQLLRKMSEQRAAGTLCIPTRDGFEFINIADILYCQADNNYCTIHLAGGDDRLVSRPLKDIESKLDPAQFLRIHQSFLINIDHVKGYSRTDGGLVIMPGQTRLPVSRSRRNAVVDRLKG